MLNMVFEKVIISSVHEPGMPESFSSVDKITKPEADLAIDKITDRSFIDIPEFTLTSSGNV